MMKKSKYLDTYNFSLVVVRHPDGRFLLVNETQNRGWWLPGGRVEHGDSFEDSAVRETKEEGGIDIVLTGLLKVERSNMQYTRMRLIYLAIPAENPPPEHPKTVPDDESVEARWVTIEELGSYRLRGDEPEVWFNYVAKGGAILPLNSFVFCNDPIPDIEEQHTKIKELNNI